MKKFNKVIINNVVIKGNGFYNQKSCNLLIESVSNPVLISFKEIMRSKKRIKSIAFECGTYESYYAGNFIITDIVDRNITLIRI